jgi:cell division protein ZapA
VSDPVTVRILDREYLVACKPEEREGLIGAAQLLDSRMREVRNGNRMAGIDRLAVLVALNLAHELGELKRQGSARESGLEQLNQRLDALIEGVATAQLPLNRG